MRHGGVPPLLLFDVLSMDWRDYKHLVGPLVAEIARPAEVFERELT